MEKFEYPYANLDFPFYVVAGNHDYGELDCLEQNHLRGRVPRGVGKMVLPATTVRVDDVGLFALDTNVMVDQFIIGDIDTDDQKLGSIRKSPTAMPCGSLRLVITYLSDGPHGNAGNYEGLPFVPIVNGSKIQDFVEESVCGKIDIYFAGHDHSRQWFDVTCGTEFVVSGAGSKTSEIVERDNNPTLYNDADLPGFLYVEIDANLLVGRFFDLNGNMNFELRS